MTLSEDSEMSEPFTPEEYAELDRELNKPVEWLILPCGCEFSPAEGDQPYLRIGRCELGVRLEHEQRDIFRRWRDHRPSPFPWSELEPLQKELAAHFEEQIAAAKKRVGRQLMEALEAFGSDDPAVAAAARETPGGRAWIAAARKVAE